MYWQMAQWALWCYLGGNLNVAMGQNSGWQEKQYLDLLAKG